MRAGLLNYPITIQEPITLKDVYGANGIDWKDANKYQSAGYL